ncbi:MAG TPA: fructosamine kinase family protein, partial [Longimicrobiaceae bacterium]|nr:fructosamine kinase family protein [Longimicrobiaceae bacterium]
LKYNLRAPAGFFAAEAEGLGALRAAAGDGLRVPAVLALGDETPWIALEWLEPAPRAPGFSERLGRGLARLHRPDGGGWGWGADNFIGPLPQPNEPAASWAEFWRARRLEPQLRRAHDVGRRPGSAREWERLFAALDGLLAPAGEDGPSLLHGDLWSGNVLATTAGPALVDPAVYRGHREVDLAMAELFGGFDAAFHAAYAEAAPLRPGYREARRGVYQLYPLLVHAVLFGGGYVAQAAETLRRVPAG